MGEVAPKLAIKAAVLAINNQTSFLFADFDYLKLRALELGQPVTTYLTKFIHHWANPMDELHHRRVHVLESLTYILNEAADMIDYDVTIRPLQEVAMSNGVIWYQTHVRFEGDQDSCYIFGEPRQ
ncbi:hypothetical protein ACP70R_031818 [Stipagrostis hirtigluma subsp. patula]